MTGKKKDIVRAVCVMTNTTKKSINGYVTFTEDPVKKRVRIGVKISGLKPGLHGIHIHRTGDLRKSCSSLCDHYNPDGKDHGGPGDSERHVGDLGNIKANSKGIVSKVFYDKLIKLRGKYSIIGRSVVIHADEDDLGRGGDKESLRTGNAGKRIACGVIGYV